MRFRLRQGLRGRVSSLPLQHPPRAPWPYTGARGILQVFENAAFSCSSDILVGLPGRGATVPVGSREKLLAEGNGWRDPKIRLWSGEQAGAGSPGAGRGNTPCDLSLGEALQCSYPSRGSRGQ